MRADQTRKYSTNNYISQMIESIPKVKRTMDQQDNESLNTMEYYNEDNNSKTQKTEESKLFSKTLLNKNKNTKTTVINSDSLLKNFKTINNKDLSEFYLNKKANHPQNRSFYSKKNVQKIFEDKKTDNEYCSRCNSEIEYSTKVCPHCLKPLCKKCLKEIFNRNLDNNDDFDNFDQNIVNEKICPNCRNKTCIKDFVTLELKSKSFLTSKVIEPLDSCSNNGDSTSSSQEEKKTVKSKDSEEHCDEYAQLMNEIEEKKKEVEVKKNLNLNILQIIKKTIEYEYTINLKKLNEMCLKLKSIKELFNSKKYKINKFKNFNNTFELNKIFDEYKNKVKNFSKIVEKFNQKLLKTKPKAYKSYESKELSINISDTYCMKFTEILSNQYIGNAYIKVDKYVNNYVNCLNFSILIRQNNKETQNNNLVNKPKFVVNMIINNKLFKLSKATKDNSQSCLNYECSLEESGLFSSKAQSNSSNTCLKKDDINIKIIITELFL